MVLIVGEGLEAILHVKGPSLVIERVNHESMDPDLLCGLKSSPQRVDQEIGTQALPLQTTVDRKPPEKDGWDRLASVVTDRSIFP